MNPPSAVLGGGVHGKVCWLIAYMTMANIQTNSFIHNTGLNEENSLSHLIDAISPDSENESTLIEHSKYYGDTEFEHALQQYM